MCYNNKMSEKLSKLVVVLGPTAVGKTALAIKLSQKFGGEIVSADSRQIYREMNLGTAKPTKKETEAVPYYLIDIVYPNQEFNVAIYKKLALQKIREIQKRGKLPFLVGGTGLYIQAIVDNIEFPRVAPQKKLRKRLEKKSTQTLFQIYQKLDQRGAKFIDKDNKRRLIRAIEVSHATGKSFWEKRKMGKSLFDVLELGITLEKEKLKEKIEKRAKRMFKGGLEKEIKTLVQKYGWIPALNTIGYQEWSPYTKASENIKRISFSLTKSQRKEVKDKIILHTFQFAKRQITWFKRNKRIHWIKNYREAEKLIKDFLN